MGHFVGVFFRVEFMRSVEDEPLAEFEHGAKQVEVVLEGRFELLGLDGGTFTKLLVPGQVADDVQHRLYYGPD